MAITIGELPEGAMRTGDAHIIADYGTFKFVEAKEETPQFYQDSCLRYILWPKAISWKP